MWNKCEDVCAGEEEVKAKGEKYLPKPSGMETEQYQSYKARAEFFNATGRTLEGLHGMLFAKKPIINIDKKYEDFLENVDGEGNSLNNFVSDCTYSTLMLGYGGVLVDAPQSEGIRSKKEAEINNIVPFMTFYKAQDIFDVRSRVVGRQRVLSFVKLREYKEEQSETNEFLVEKKEVYRVLSLDENGNYFQRVFNEQSQLESTFYPTKNGQYLKEIPFFPLPSQRATKPILLDLVNVNLAWYRKSADLENGAHWTGVPTPYVIGYEPETKYDKEGKEIPAKPIELGGSTMIAFPSSVTQVNYLEFNGAGLSQLANLMEQDEERMAILGAKIISNEKKGVESAKAAEIHNSGARSVLAKFANNVSTILTKALSLYLSWTTETDVKDVSFSLNTDFDLSQMDPSLITALVSLWQSGGISKKILFSSLKQGEIVSSEISFEEMQTEIEEEQETNLQKRIEMQTLLEEKNNDV